MELGVVGQEFDQSAYTVNVWLLRIFAVAADHFALELADRFVAIKGYLTDCFLELILKIDDEGFEKLDYLPILETSQNELEFFLRVHRNEYMI